MKTFFDKIFPVCLRYMCVCEFVDERYISKLDRIGSGLTRIGSVLCVFLPQLPQISGPEILKNLYSSTIRLLMSPTSLSLLT